MHLLDLLSPARVRTDAIVSGKKRLLERVAGLLADGAGGEGERAIFDTLCGRERLGSTGLGHGVAIPHGKLRALTGLAGVFAKLARPVDFDSLDDQPVDLVFVLLAPEGAGADHLKALARISRLLRDPSFVLKLRGTDSAAGLYAILTEPLASSHAA